MYSIYSVWKTNNTAKKNLTWFSVLLVSRSFKLRPCFLIQNFGCQAQKITYGSENSKNLTERYLQVLYLITVHEKRCMKVSMWRILPRHFCKRIIHYFLIFRRKYLVVASNYCTSLPTLDTTHTKNGWWNKNKSQVKTRKKR